MIDELQAGQRGRLIARAAALGCGLLLAVAVVQANYGGGALTRLAGQVAFGDKLGHAALYGSLAFLSSWAFAWRATRIFGWRCDLGIALVSAIAVLEEASQALIRTRTFDLLDLIADAVGLLVAAIAIAAVQRVATRRASLPEGQCAPATTLQRRD